MRQSIGAPNEQGAVGGSVGGSQPSIQAGLPATGSTPVVPGGTVPAGGEAVGASLTLSKQQVSICMQVVTVLNLFITYGDSFLPSPSDYDDLYYEIMRVSKTLEHFYAIAEKYEHSQEGLQAHHVPVVGSTDSHPPSDVHADVDAHGLATLSMLNIKTIISHFSGKIQQWNFAHPEVTLTPDMVLRIIKDNYDSLKLKLQENLDYFEPCIRNISKYFNYFEVIWILLNKILYLSR